MKIKEKFCSETAMGKAEVIKTTCLKCGLTENIPDFIYDEFSRKKYHLKIKRKVSTLACQRCGKETAISAYWLKDNQ